MQCLAEEKLLSSSRHVDGEELDEELLLPSKSRDFMQRPWKGLSYALLTALILSVALSAHRGLRTGSKPGLDSLCGRHIEQCESPLLDEIPASYGTVSFNGSFVKKIIYRQRPSPAVGAAWDDLGANLEGFTVPESEAVRFGLHPGMVKRVPRQDGGYIVLSEGIHALHCLNVLRQSSYFSYQYYRELGEGAFKNDDAVMENHIGHCVDILRQQLMCTFDTGVFGQWWVKDIGPFVDFNTEHRCKNFDSLRDWVRNRVEEHAATGRMVRFREGDVLLSDLP